MWQKLVRGRGGGGGGFSAPFLFGIEFYFIFFYFGKNYYAFVNPIYNVHMVLKTKISYAVSRIYLHRRSIQAIKNIKYYKNHKAAIKQWIYITLYGNP